MQPDSSLHTWADNPRSIGTLAVIQLGIFASDKESYRNSNFLNDLKKFRVVEVLARLIKSDQRDQFEAAVLALSFLTENLEEVAEEVIALNLMPWIVKFMNDQKEGLRATAALCSRNLYYARPKVQKAFMREGGGELLIRLLDSDDSVVVFETILNVLDLMLDSEDLVQMDIKKDLVALGIVGNLHRILSSASRYEQDTIKEAEKLLQLFE
jgi:hypothetical protein